jgi:hypothetical protein
MLCVGAAIEGMHPIAEMQFAVAVLPAFALSICGAQPFLFRVEYGDTSRLVLPKVGGPTHALLPVTGQYWIRFAAKIDSEVERFWRRVVRLSMGY